MSIFGKLAFWKKKDDLMLSPGLGLQQNLGLDSGFGTPGMGTQLQQPLQPFSLGPSAQFAPLGQPASPGFGMDLQGIQGYGASKDLEVISAKLDALRSALESINQRLANLERIARGEQDTEAYRRRGW